MKARIKALENDYCIYEDGKIFIAIPGHVAIELAKLKRQVFAIENESSSESSSSSSESDSVDWFYEISFKILFC